MAINNSSELKVSKLSPEEIENILVNRYGNKLLSIDYSRSKKAHLQSERIATVGDVQGITPALSSEKTYE